MLHFHEHKLWQDSFVILMKIHDVIEEHEDSNNDLIEAVLEAAQNVTAKIADGLSRKDRKVGRSLIYDAVGLVAITRTQLAIAWGRGFFNDETFKKIDNKYASLSESLQNFR